MDKQYIIAGLGLLVIGSILYLAYEDIEQNPLAVTVMIGSAAALLIMEPRILKGVQ